YINNDLEKNFKISVPMKVIYNPIELLSSVTYNSEVGRNIIYVGKLGDIKNPMLLLKAIQRQTNNEFTVTFVGNGSHKSKLEDYIIQNNLKNIHFTGIIDNVNY